MSGRTMLAQGADGIEGFHIKAFLRRAQGLSELEGRLYQEGCAAVCPPGGRLFGTGQFNTGLADTGRFNP